MIEQWRPHYNTIRPTHRSIIGHLAPQTLMLQCDGLHPAGTNNQLGHSADWIRLGRRSQQSQSISLDTWYAVGVRLKTSSEFDLMLDGKTVQIDAAWQEAAANLELLRLQQSTKHTNEIYVAHVRYRP